jgi:surface protein
MFKSCKNIKELDVKNFDSSSVTDMTNMFSSCESLKNINLKNFKTQNVVMVGACSKIVKICKVLIWIILTQKKLLICRVCF